MPGTPASRILRYEGEYDSTLPENVSIAQFILDYAKEYGDDEACINSETKETLTYSEIIRATQALATGLQLKFKLASGDRVAIALPLCLEYPIACMAVHLCGATAVFINPAQTINELNHVVNITSPVKIWFGDDHFAKKFHSLYPVDGALKSQFVALKGLLWQELMAQGKKGIFKVPTIRIKEDVASVFFSSGTTGVPKGVMLTHSNLLAARKMSIELMKTFPRSPEVVGCVFLPPYHTAGFTALIEAIAFGIRFVLVPNFTFHKLLQAVQDYKIATLVVVPAIAVALAKEPVEKQYDLSSLMAFRSGSAAVSKEIILKLQEKFNCMYFQVYGMTETTLATHVNSIDYNKEGSIGIVRPFCESKVVDLETNEALGPNQEGEICVRGELVMKGYIGNEEATRNTIDAEGWLHSGDIGYYDEEGFFYITDRLKELIKYNGFQVSPTELETILLTHPEVLEAAVAPVPHESAGELPRAYVVRRPGSKVTEDELEKLVADKVSPYKRLRGGVVFIESIPKSPTGKILRRELKKLASKL